MTAQPPTPPGHIVTRFAPSPTGELHVGGARTALFAWAFARQAGGTFILRIEDTDQRRSSAEATHHLLRDLKWLGLDWDQGPDPEAGDPSIDQRGDRGPYFQSQRLDLYHRHIDRLLADGRAYEGEGEYAGTVRFRMGRDVAFDDAVYGRVETPGRELEDFVIRKGDGYPTFHLAVTVDDALMGVTHVLRGQEHLSNTPKHVALQDALGFDRPVYAHTPSIMNADGSKMSKRDKAKAARDAAKAVEASRLVPPLPAEPGSPLAAIPPADLQAFLNKENDRLDIAEALAAALGVALPEVNVADFRRSGFLPGVLLNYIALLGWNPGGDEERFELDAFVQRFSLADINKKNARFDRDKLRAFNADTLQAMDAERFADLLREHLEAYHPAFQPITGDALRMRLFAQAYQQRARTLDEPSEAGRLFIVPDDELVYDDKAVEKNLLKNESEGLALLRELRDRLAAIDEASWSGEAAQAAVEALATGQNLKLGKVAQPLRVAVAGSAVSPPLDDTLALLGRTSVLARIDRCLASRAVAAL